MLQSDYTASCCTSNSRSHCPRHSCRGDWLTTKPRTKACADGSTSARRCTAKASQNQKEAHWNAKAVVYVRVERFFLASSSSLISTVQAWLVLCLASPMQPLSKLAVQLHNSLCRKPQLGLYPCSGIVGCCITSEVQLAGTPSPLQSCDYHEIRFAQGFPMTSICSCTCLKVCGSNLIMRFGMVGVMSAAFFVLIEKHSTIQLKVRPSKCCVYEQHPIW